MRTRWVLLGFAAVFCGVLVGSLFAPQPAGAVNRDMVELQQQVSQLLQGQQDLRSAVDTNSASLKTLVEQSLDSVNKVNGQMAALQKAVEEVQANTGARIDSMTQQTQGISDNVQDVQARVGKLSQQLNDIQSTLQSIDAKVSGGAPTSGTAAPSAPGAGEPSGGPGPSSSNGAGSNGAGSPLAPISADTLYQNALRDYTGGKYDLSQQEFSDYIRNFPSNDLASNSQFYLGEIAYQQNDFKAAIMAYDVVLERYPKSFKLAASLLKRGMAELELGMKAGGIRDLRDVVRRFAGSDEARRANAKLHEVGAPVAPRPAAR